MTASESPVVPALKSEAVRPRSCAGKALISFVDGGTFGAAIGAIVASAQAVSSFATVRAIDQIQRLHCY